MSAPSDAGTRRGPAPHKHVEILWAAARLFAEHGVDRTTTRQVAAAAKTTERTLFKHFGSKDGLVRAVIEEAVVAQLAPASLKLLHDAIDADAPLEHWHVALLRSRSDATARTPELTRLLVVEIFRDAGLRARFAELWLAQAWVPLLDRLRRLQADGQVRDDLSVESMAVAFLSLNVGWLLARHVLAPDRGWDDESAIQATASVFRTGVAGRDAKS